MKKKVSEFLKKYWDILVYLIFGVLTTMVNYLVYLPVYNIIGMSAAMSNVIAWVVAVFFAYLTNKPFVFQSHDWSMETVIPEFVRFVSCRIVSGATETGILFLTVDLFGWDGNIWKLLTSAFVVVLNYIFSKLIVFRNRK